MEIGSGPNQIRTGENGRRRCLGIRITYQNKITGELGHLRIEGYKFREAFRGQCILRFALTHEGERSLALMTKVTYKGNIDRYLVEMENHNTHVGMSGVAWRQRVE